MRILHYFLGFPPYRSGGLTKYCNDLMFAQAQCGDTVAAMWPGQMGLIDRKVRVRYRGQVGTISSYELINPLPISLDEGIVDIPAFTQSCNADVFTDFLKEYRPDAIHIHTLMGLYREFILSANELGIRTVFTTHDYFGLCPKVTMYSRNGVCSAYVDCGSCPTCNQNALSLHKIRLMQSPLYRALKDSSLVKRLRKRHRQDFFAEDNQSDLPHTCEVSALEYQKLRSYYVDMLSLVDVIHFNSSVAQQVYSRFFTPKSARLISITHKDITDNQQQPLKSSEFLRLTYLAPTKPFKGYRVIKQALDTLWERGNRNFVLKLYSPVKNPSPYMRVQEEGYHYSELPAIFADTDVLLAPSVWYETFGFTVLEALSYSVPVIISKNVGAKDIVGNAGVLVEPGSAESIMQAVESLTEESLEQLRQAAGQVRIKNWTEFVAENNTLYKKNP